MSMKRVTSDNAAEDIEQRQQDEYESKEEGQMDDFKSLLWTLRRPQFEEAVAGASKGVCPQCNADRKFFCIECQCAVLGHEYVPKVKLPVQMEIVRHPQENPWKGSSIQAAALSDEAHLWAIPGTGKFAGNLPMAPDFSEEDTVLLYPTEGAIDVMSVDWNKIQRVVVIDSAWKKSSSISKRPEFAKLKAIKIKSEKSYYWRWHNKGQECMSTMEAIYHLVRQVHLSKFGSYHGECDNLLFYFSYFYRIVQNHYLENPALSFGHKDNYIDYERGTKMLKGNEGPMRSEPGAVASRMMAAAVDEMKMEERSQLAVEATSTLFKDEEIKQ